MNWDAIGAVAELLAAVGVIISLIFVGLQVRKSNAVSRAATMQATTDTEINMVSIFARHAGVWNKIHTGEPLESGEEKRLGIVLFALLMIDHENKFYQHRAGFYDEASWQSRVDNLHKIVAFPIFELWRQSPGGRSRGADYTKFIDRIAAEVHGEE